MLDVLGRKGFGFNPSDLILAFIKSWELHGGDESSISSGALDVMRAFLGDRPCCIWKKVGQGLAIVSERGMVGMFYATDEPEHQMALNRTLVTGAPEFDLCPINPISKDIKFGYDGFLHVPIKRQDDILGVFSIATKKKESRDVTFIQPLECLGRLMAIAFREWYVQQNSSARERRLRSEVEATTKELERTNTRLIDRVKELKGLSGQLQERVKELTIANKTKDEFLSVVSHELRTPLTALNGFLCVLLDQEAGDLTATQEKFLKIAKQSADRLKILIEDLLDISRIQSGRLTLQMEEISLFDILKQSVDGLTSTAEDKSVQIRLQSVPNLPSVWGDPNRIQQVLDNLLSNAIKFSDKESKVDVYTEVKGPHIEVAVRDEGPGLNPEEQKKIFNLFFQAEASIRRSTGGAGLGLSIAKGIVSLHGGRIWVESERGRGSTFKFIIPLLRKQNAA